MTSNWTAEDIPDQRGRTAIVTGGNSGLGRIVARELPGHGAAGIIASRDVAKAAEAARGIALTFPSSTLEARQLDPGNPSSIRWFGDRIRAARHHSPPPTNHTR